MVEEIILSAMQTPDGYWRVEVYRERGARKQWFRVLHAATVVADKAPIGVVRDILGDQYAALEPVAAA